MRTVNMYGNTPDGWQLLIGGLDAEMLAAGLACIGLAIGQLGAGALLPAYSDGAPHRPGLAIATDHDIERRTIFAGLGPQTRASQINLLAMYNNRIIGHGAEPLHWQAGGLILAAALAATEVYFLYSEGGPR